MEFLVTTQPVGGTVVSTVLETAGYYVQSLILDQFVNYFISIGALIFVFCAMGAFISVAMTGSYRLAGYILLGPGLLSFVVFYREPIEPAAWKFAGTSTVDTSNYFDIGRLQNLGYNADQELRVSWVFKWFVELSSSLTNTIADAIVELDETERAAGMGIRQQLLDTITEAMPQDDETYKILMETLYNGPCTKMMVLYTALGEKKYSNHELQQQFAIHADLARDVTCPSGDLAACRDDFISQLPAGTQNKFRQTLREKQELLRALHEAKNQRITAGPALSQFLIEREFKYGSLSQQAAGSNANMTCGEAEDIIFDVLMEDSNDLQSTVANRLNTDGLSDDEAANARLAVCQMVNGKVFGINSKTVTVVGEAGTENPWNQPWAQPYFQEECSLASAMSMNMFRNIISGGFFSKGIRDAAQRFEFEEGRTIFARCTRHDTGEESSDCIRINDEALGAIATRVQNNTLTYRDENTGRYTRALHTATMSDMEAAFLSHQQYYMRQTVQELYTLGLNLPYWQGVILFLVAVAFPLLAVVLIIPGKGHLFIYVPLCWLWIKSWDIGYAMVAVFDRIMWDLLPSQALPLQEALTNDFMGTVDNLQNGQTFPANSPAFDATSAMLDAILAVDPTYTSQLHAMFTSLALSSIPIITGKVILQTKRVSFDEAFSIFTREIDQSARDAGEMARSAYGMRHMTALTQGHPDIYGFAAADRIHPLGGGISTMFTDPTGRKYAVDAALLTTAGQLAGGATNLKNWKDIPSSIRTGLLAPAVAVEANQFISGLFDSMEEKGVSTVEEFNKALQEYMTDGNLEAIGAVALFGNVDTAKRFFNNFVGSYANIWRDRELAYSVLNENFHPVLGRRGLLTRLRVASANAQEGDGAVEEHVDTNESQGAMAYATFVDSLNREVRLGFQKGFFETVQGNIVTTLASAYGITLSEDDHENLARVLLDTSNEISQDWMKLMGVGGFGADQNEFGTGLSDGVVFNAAQRRQLAISFDDLMERTYGAVKGYNEDAFGVMMARDGAEVKPEQVLYEILDAADSGLENLRFQEYIADQGLEAPPYFATWTEQNYVSAYNEIPVQGERADRIITEMNAMADKINNLRDEYGDQAVDNLLQNGTMASRLVTPEYTIMMQVLSAPEGSTMLSHVKGDRLKVEELQHSNPSLYLALEALDTAIWGPNSRLANDQIGEDD